MEIRNKHTKAILYACDATTMREALVEAIQSGANLHGADLSGAILSETDLHGADLHGADLHGADLHGANLRRANLTVAKLYGANLSGAVMSEGSLSYADLGDARLLGTDLGGANLHGADLSDADLTGADLTGADLHGVDFNNADLGGIDLSGVDLNYSHLYKTQYGYRIPMSRPPISLTGLLWPVLILDSHMKIGCEIHSHKKWSSFSARHVASMDFRALKFWLRWKEPLLALCREHATTKGRSK